MPKLMPNPIGDIQKPLANMEGTLVEVRDKLDALIEVRDKLDRLADIEREVSEGFAATCKRLDRIADLLEAQAAPSKARNGRAVA